MHLIVVCADAEQKCPRMFPGALPSWYRPFDDPASAPGTEEERPAKFREVRDQIRQKIPEWLPIVASHQ
jgi:arsenate reductase